MNELKTYTRPDTLTDIRDADLVQLSRKLLDNVIVSTNALNSTEMTPERLQEMKLVLGFLKATNNMINSKLHYFHLQKIDEKVAAIREQTAKIEGTPVPAQ